MTSLDRLRQFEEAWERAGADKDPPDWREFLLPVNHPEASEFLGDLLRADLERHLGRATSAPCRRLRCFRGRLSHAGRVVPADRTRIPAMLAAKHQGCDTSRSSEAVSPSRGSDKGGPVAHLGVPRLRGPSARER